VHVPERCGVLAKLAGRCEVALQVSQAAAGDAEAFCESAEGDEVDAAPGGVFADLREFVDERGCGGLGSVDRTMRPLWALRRS
jgi:hypothetical protein